jgi:hypothetical protein
MISQAMRDSWNLMDPKIRYVGLAILTARYTINTDLDGAEKHGGMAYVGARHSNDALWMLVTGILLSGTIARETVNGRRVREAK